MRGAGVDGRWGMAAAKPNTDPVPVETGDSLTDYVSREVGRARYGHLPQFAAPLPINWVNEPQQMDLPFSEWY